MQIHQQAVKVLANSLGLLEQLKAVGILLEVAKPMLCTKLLHGPHAHLLSCLRGSTENF